jgi:hypothetical protein
VLIEARISALVKKQDVGQGEQAAAVAGDRMEGWAKAQRRSRFVSLH